MKRMIIVLTALSTALALAVPVGAVEQGGSPAGSGANHGYVLVTLPSPPTAAYEGGIPGLARTRPERGDRLDLNSPAVAAYRRHLSAEQAAFIDELGRKAPGVEVVRSYSLVFNGLALKLNGHSINEVARVSGISHLDYSQLYKPTMDVSPTLIGADQVWPSLGGQANAGEGIKVGIIDTGIDISNPFFDDSAYTSTTQIDQCPDQDLDPSTDNTNNKVIVCRVYASGVAPGAAGEHRALVVDHGTHVAGTVAGDPDTTGKVVVTPDDPDTTENEEVSVLIDGLSGVAPKAWLGNYNVFPGFGAGFVAFGGSAFSHDIIAALEDGVADGMDVLNLSLGGTVQGPHDPLAEAVNATVDAGLVVAVAAGNSGPGDATVESPGNAAGALTAGATTNPHFLGIPVEVSGLGTFGAALGDFDNFDPAITADYQVTEPANGCSAISTDLTGKIALIDRGACSFTTKIRNAEDAGAVGVLVANNVAGDPVAMGHDGTNPFPTIPAAMVSKDDGATMRPSGTVTVDGTSPAEFLTDNADIIAGFSSRGPTPFDYLIKPDVTAPGVNVLSSVFGDEFAFFQGTSMATPHLAGSAALLLDLHPGWSPADVKSALVNTAERVVTDSATGTSDPGVLARGGGRINLAFANEVPVTLDPVSVSFGLWQGNKPVTATADVTAKNVTDSSQACEVSVTGPDIVTASPSSFTLAAGATTTLSVALDAGRSQQTPGGDYSGDIVIDCTGGSLQAPWWVRIDRLAKP